jgi:hypothetical protein
VDRRVLSNSLPSARMDEQFQAYFRRRADAYERRLGPPGLRGYIQPRRFSPGGFPPDVADEAGRRALLAARDEAENRGLQLRGDAELLILFLAQDLVAEPVAEVTPEEAGDLPAIVAADVITIVARCAEQADNHEISAHAIIDALSGSWDQLESGRFRVWDRYRGSDGPEAGPSG